MSKKSVGGICAIISMVSVAAFLIWGMLAHSYEHAWIVFVISGIACASVSIINRIRQEEGADKEKPHDQTNE